MSVRGCERNLSNIAQPRAQPRSHPSSRGGEYAKREADPTQELIREPRSISRPVRAPVSQQRERRKRDGGREGYRGRCDIEAGLTGLASDDYVLWTIDSELRGKALVDYTYMGRQVWHKHTIQCNNNTALYRAYVTCLTPHPAVKLVFTGVICMRI